MSEDTVLIDNPEAKRYELRLGGALAGFAEYRRKDEQLAITHTEIDPRFEGRGLGGVLIGHVLAEARAAGTAVLPFCPFARGYIDRHREYLPLVPVARRAHFDLPTEE